MLKNRPIQTKMMLVILTTSAVVLLLTSSGYFAYEYYSFRKTTVYQLTIISKMIAANSTAAIAFENKEDATEVLSALEVEPHVQAGILYNKEGEIFAEYYSKDPIEVPVKKPDWEGFRFQGGNVVGLQPVIHEGNLMGSLYLKSDINAIYERFQLYIAIASLVVLISFLVSYLLSRRMQKSLSEPILNLADTAKAISENADYSVRAKKFDNDEIGLLTEAFNKMLVRIENQNQEITSLNQGLEMKVANRTKELEQAYSEMEAFSYIVSHDLSAPLRHIDSYLGMYLTTYENSMDDNAKKTLGSVTRNAQKMRQLINDLLEFSQLGRRELKRSKISMQQIVESIWEDHRKLENGRAINFKIADLPDTIADSTTIRQVWENLISNALKYSGHKHTRNIEIACVELKDEFRFSIKDNGAGFDMNQYNKLFNPFQRLHSQSEFAGTGVGLAIVERIVSKHGGKVWAESDLGEGSTFYFSLPKG